MINAATDNPAGTNRWVTVWNYSWESGVNTSWVSQIALGTHDNTGMWYRTRSGTIVGAAWTRILDASNYSSYTVTKTGSGASGTWGINVTGNAATATKAKVTDYTPSSGVFYDIPFTTVGTDNKDLYQNDGLQYYSLQGTTTARGESLICLGNSKNQGTAGNKTGRIRIYNPNTGYTDIYATNSSANNTIYFPAASGTLCLTGHTHNYAGSNTAGGGATKMYLPRVAKSAASQPGANTMSVEEFTAGTDYSLPTNHWYHIFTAQGSDPKYNTQLALGMTNQAIYYRYRNNGTLGSWKQLAFIDSTVSAATKAAQDSSGQQINTTYIKALSVNGRTITYTKGDGTTGTITTQDTNTTYSNMSGASSATAGKSGLVPAPAAGHHGDFLRGDGTWATPVNTNTWRDITDSLTSSDSTISLSAKAGKSLKDSIDTINSNLDWVYISTVVGTAGITVPSETKELFLCVYFIHNNTTYAYNNIILIEQLPENGLSEAYGMGGYYEASGDTGSVFVNVSKTKVSLRTCIFAGVNYISSAKLSVRYRK